VLLDAIQAGVNLNTWEIDSFAYAENYDDASHRYRGLRTAMIVSINESDGALLVKPAVARRQMEAETRPPAATPGPVVTPDGDNGTIVPPSANPRGTETTVAVTPTAAPKPRRFHGSVTLDPARVGRDASKIADEVITHLAGLLGANVRVTLEIEADIPNGTPDNVVRTVTENSRVLKFTQAGFEEE
jgi:hypothetical protein